MSSFWSLQRDQISREGILAGVELLPHVSYTDRNVPHVYTLSYVRGFENLLQSVILLNKSTDRYIRENRLIEGYQGINNSNKGAWKERNRLGRKNFQTFSFFIIIPKEKWE